MKSFGKRTLTEAALPPVAERPRPEVAVEEKAGFGNPLLREKVLKQIDPAVAANLSTEILEREVEAIVHEIANQERIEISGHEQFLLAKEIANDMTGYGPLQILLRDDDVNDIMVNGPTSIYVERRGRLERADIAFRDNAHIMSIAQKIAARVGRRIDESSPMVDARLPDGSRVNVVFPPLAIDSPCVSIRKFPKRRLDLSGLVANGSMTQSVARLLEIAARCRLNILISGGTGSGKTTLLNAISQFIDHRDRIITIEDAAELQLQQPHVVRLETRPANLEGVGQINQRDLVRNALRMRPDRIILGEVRGEEAFDMLQAMNTGHDGSISTVHANTTRDAITRIENMLQMGHANLPLRAIRSQIVSAIDIIIQQERMRDGQRRVLQITEICGLEGEVVTTNDIAAFQFDRETHEGRLTGKYVSSGNVPAFIDRLAYFGFDRAWADAVRTL